MTAQLNRYLFVVRATQKGSISRSRSNSNERFSFLFALPQCQIERKRKNIYNVESFETITFMNSKIDCMNSVEAPLPNRIKLAVAGAEAYAETV